MYNCLLSGCTRLTWVTNGSLTLSPSTAFHKLRIPEPLLEAARERILIPFIGSGFSRNVDEHLPTSDSLITIIASELRIDPRLLQIHSHDDWKLCAEYLYSQRRTLGDALEQLVLQLEPAGGRRQLIERSKAHLKLAELDTPVIYTTNWDSWIEEGLRCAGRSYYKIRSSDDLTAPVLIEGKVDDARMKPFLIKFHGDFSQPETIVLKQTDYFRRMRFDDPLDIRLQSDVYGRSVLFLGYSFSDPNIQHIWYRLAEILRKVKGARRSYLLTHVNNPVMDSFLNDNFIDVIRVKPLGIGEAVEDLLNELVAVQSN
jgi:hypothetical protein